MTGKLLLDTNAVIALFAQDQEAIRHISSTPQVYMPVTVAGELLFGARQSSRADANLDRIRDFIRLMQLVVCDQATAEQYGLIKDTLKRTGRPIPENDIWIAAMALQHDLPLMSRDTHFDHVPNLHRLQW